jgi:ERCC4-related helicase
VEYFEKSLEKNSIIFLETGGGKTIISIMHIYYYLKKYNLSKKIIFLGNTI